MGIGEYEYQRFGLRNRIERLFRYLKERTNGVPHRDHTQGTVDLNLFPNIFTLYYQTIKEGGGQTCLMARAASNNITLAAIASSIILTVAFYSIATPMSQILFGTDRYATLVEVIATTAFPTI